MNFSYLKFPVIPDEFLKNIYLRKNLAYSKFYEEINKKEVYGSRIAHVDNNLKKWIVTNIFPYLNPTNEYVDHIMIHVSEYIVYNDEHNGWKYHNVSGIVPIHKDWSRSFPVNYVIEAGGNNVITSWYNDDHSLIEEHKIKPNKWHILSGKVFHGVKGIEPGKERILISINWDPTNAENFKIQSDMKDLIDG
jgi:hypothetical protein